jgi:hypothetical protein
MPSQNNVANDWIDYMNRKYNENGTEVMEYKNFEQVIRLLALECNIKFFYYHTNKLIFKKKIF